MPRDFKTREVQETKVVQEQKPAPKAIHKRRSEDEMRRALADFAAGKPRLRDDERETILDDAITELIDMRRIMMRVTQTVQALHEETTNDIKKILSPQ